MIDRLEIKSRAKDILLREKHKPNIFLVTLVYVIILFILSIIQTYLSDFPSFNDLLNDALENPAIPSLKGIFTIRGTLFYVISTVISAVISLGYTIYTLNITRGKKGSFWILFEGFEYFFKYIFMYILTSIIITAGSVLLIVPGIILSLMFSQAIYIMLDNPGMSVIGCMKESSRLMKGHKKEYLVLVLSLFGWYLLAPLLEFFIGIFGWALYIWIYPYTNLIFALYYNALRPRHGTKPPEYDGPNA